MPGLVNCHTHAPMVALRGLAEDLPTEEWFNDVVWPVESNLTEQDVASGARLACAEMIRGGVTCFADHYFAMDAVAAVVAECGMRAHLGQAYFSSQGDRGCEESLEFALRHRGGAGGRITTALAPHAPYTVTDADLAATAELARAHGLPVHLHASENRDQVVTSLAPVRRHPHRGAGAHRRSRHGRPHRARHRHPGARPARPRTRAWPYGGGERAARLPQVRLAHTTTPVRAVREIGVPVGLATDGAVSNNSLDVWEAMALTALIQKSATGDPRRLTSRQALYHATLQSAQAVGLAGQVGSLAPARRADIVLVDLTGPHTQPVHDLAATLVHSARSGDVRTTIVDGRTLMRDRELLTIDVPEVVAELGRRTPAFLDRSHGRRIQEYDT